MKKIIKDFIEYFSNKKEINLSEISNWELKAEKLQTRINYKFSNIILLKASLTHVSYLRNNDSNPKALSTFERMEFLGDSILGFIVSEALFIKYPKEQEGVLSKYKSKIVSEKYLAMKANDICLGECLLLSKDEAKAGGRERKSITSDSMESLICAIYLDSNFDNARKFVINTILTDFEKIIKSEELINYKSILQEYTQSKFQIPPSYRIINEEGPDHKKIFTIEVYFQDQKLGTGVGYSKKEAQQCAAKEACAKLNLATDFTSKK